MLLRLLTLVTLRCCAFAFAAVTDGALGINSPCLLLAHRTKVESCFFAPSIILDDAAESKGYTYCSCMCFDFFFSLMFSVFSALLLVCIHVKYDYIRTIIMFRSTTLVRSLTYLHALLLHDDHSGAPNMMCRKAGRDARNGIFCPVSLLSAHNSAPRLFAGRSLGHAVPRGTHVLRGFALFRQRPDNRSPIPRVPPSFSRVAPTISLVNISTFSSLSQGYSFNAVSHLRLACAPSRLFPPSHWRLSPPASHECRAE